MGTKPDTRWGNRHEFQADPINFCRCGLHKANPVHDQRPVMPSYEELERELAEAKRDTARLDWLEQSKRGVEYDEAEASNGWFVHNSSKKERKSLRAAIDAELPKQESN